MVTTEQSMMNPGSSSVSCGTQWSPLTKRKLKRWATNSGWTTIIDTFLSFSRIGLLIVSTCDSWANDIGTKKLGDSFTAEEKLALKIKNDLNFDNVGFLLQLIPFEVLLIFKAMHLVTVHNKRFGVRNRLKFMRFTDEAINALSLSSSLTMAYWRYRLTFLIRVFLFEYFPSIFQFFFRRSEKTEA